jgi:hypothetical protein
MQCDCDCRPTPASCNFGHSSAVSDTGSAARAHARRLSLPTTYQVPRPPERVLLSRIWQPACCEGGQNEETMRTPAIQRLTGILAFSLFGMACGGGGSPAAPGSTTQPGPGGFTATIGGSVRAGSTQLASTSSGAPAGLIVSVAGTSISSGIDAAGRFNLTGVPAGDVRLQFKAGGLDATVPLSPVQPSQSVELAVNVSGSTVIVEAELRSMAGDVELEGRIESLPPNTSAGSLVVAGRTVNTTATTRIEQGGAERTFDDLLIGMRVHVKGTASGTAVAATRITIQNTTTWIPVTINGIVESLSGTADLFEMTVNDRLVKGDALTVYFGNGGRDDFSKLQVGLRVEIKGQQRNAYVYAERLHVHDPSDGGDDDGGQQQSASIHGTLTARSGTQPNLTLTVGGTTVRTSAGTVVQRRGDVQTLEQLQIGQSLHVVGDRQADGSLDARRIQIEDDAVGGEMEIEGPAGGVSGTCPALHFVVMGHSVATSGATTFEGGTCSSLRSGMRVTVNGTRQADGSILATRVRR